MKKIFSGCGVFVIFFPILILNIGNAQTPANDPNWQLVPSASDEFNTTSLDLTKWRAIDAITESPPFSGYSWGGLDYYRSSNVTVNNGTLNLKTDGPNPGATYPYVFAECCYSGGIMALNESYNYGYIEVYALFPGVQNDANDSLGPYWPAIWTFHDEYQGNCHTIHDELDIVDQGNSEYADGRTTGRGWGDELNCNSIIGYPSPWSLYSSPTKLFEQYHLFAVEWNSNKIIYYIDNIPVYEEYNNPLMPMDPMRLVVNLEMDIGGPNFSPGTTFPQYMKVDYIHYYQLKKDCSTNVFVNNNTDLANFVYAVKSNITFGTGANTISLNSTDQKYFRAVNSITINSDFTVPLGAELALMPTDCN